MAEQCAKDASEKHFQSNYRKKTFYTAGNLFRVFTDSKSYVEKSTCDEETGNYNVSVIVRAKETSRKL